MNIILKSVLFVGLLLVANSLVCSEENVSDNSSAAEAEFKPLPEGETLVTPPNESVLLGSQIGMIVRGKFDTLFLDKEPIKFSKRIQTSSASFAVLPVSPGRHSVSMSAQDGRALSFKFVTAINDMEHGGPKTWTRFYQHQFEKISNPCEKCHFTRKTEDKVEVGYWKPVSLSCKTCHVDQKRLKLEGFHENLKAQGWDDTNWIETCTECHYVHQGTSRKLLRENCPRAPKE